MPEMDGIEACKKILEFFGTYQESERRAKPMIYALTSESDQ